MTAHLDLTLTPAQWEHLAEHGWTLTAVPTEACGSYESVKLRAQHQDGASMSDIADRYGITRERVRQLVTREHPVPATVPCPECEGDTGGYAPCDSCNPTGEDANPGVVPRVVGIVRPEEVVSFTGGGRWVPGVQVVPAERVGTATVTAVPVVDVGDAPPDVPHVVVSGVTGTVWWCGGERVGSGRGSTVWTDVQQVQVLFATPPNPGSTVWRLDKENDR